MVTLPHPKLECFRRKLCCAVGEAGKEKGCDSSSRQRYTKRSKENSIKNCRVGQHKMKHQDGREISQQSLFGRHIYRQCIAMVLQDYLRTVTTLPRPARSSDLSPIEQIWNIWDGELAIPRVLAN
ncbi:hypothetical protein TNCV_144031 [Trichonephila clavipes]|nr:hypothetical protein TNCV_144031 [Trichonephila clavipes]